MLGAVKLACWALSSSPWTTSTRSYRKIVCSTRCVLADAWNGPLRRCSRYGPSLVIQLVCERLPLQRLDVVFKAKSPFVFSSCIGVSSAPHDAACDCGEANALSRRCTGNIMVLNSDATPRAILRELCFAAGLYPEHQRWDRDVYIDVDADSAIPGSTIQVLYGCEGRSLSPYDHLSVTHAPSLSWKLASCKHVNTIREVRKSTLYPSLSLAFLLDKLGTASDMSKMDVFRITQLYQPPVSFKLLGDAEWETV